MARNFLTITKRLRARNSAMMIAATRSNHRSASSSSSAAAEEEEEWCKAAFAKMKKWSQQLKDLDLIGGRLVSVHDNTRVFDEKLERKMLAFKSIGRELIVLPSMQETLKSNLINSSADQCYHELDYFTGPHEREPLTVTSLTKVADVLNITAQQRKVVRKHVGPQVTQHKIWTGALVEILNGLRHEVGTLIERGSSKEVALSQQILTNCLKILESAVSHDEESSSWMRLPPTKGADSKNSPKWGDALEMCTDLANCLCNEDHLSFHVSKLDIMKEGLFQIRDVLIDKSIGYKESRYQEHLVGKRLTRALGHSSKCLFTLLAYYLNGAVGDVEMEVRGGVHVVGIGGRVCLYAGKILTADEEEVVRSGAKRLDAAMGLFKFVWESAGVKGELEVQGHLWCVGARNRSFTYRGNVYLVHAIDL